MTEISRTIIHKAPASLAAPLPARVASGNMAAGTRIRTRKVSPSHTPRSALMIVSEVMPSPDCHDDPTNQHGTGFHSGRHGCQLGIEGLVSKRLGSRYRSGRTSDWLNR